MAWEDRTPFEAISFQFDLEESEVIRLMRTNLKTSSFKLWRKRVTGRKSKHGFPSHKTRFKSPNQKWKLNWLKIVQNAKETFNGERNGLRTGKMLFTALKDVEEEKTKLTLLNNFFALKYKSG